LALLIYTKNGVTEDRHNVTMAYCVKCRAQREVRNPEAMVMKNRRPAIAGVCPVCGTKLFRIGEQRAFCGAVPFLLP